jgi:hypothetical protein
MSDYGMKVLDPVTGYDLFNAKYPIFGSDVSNATPQIITHRLTITNSSGLFNEPATPSIPYVADNQWHYMDYNQVSRRLVAAIPHGQKKAPMIMTVGRNDVRFTMRVRYYEYDRDGTTPYNNVYLPYSPSGGNWTYVNPPFFGGPTSLEPYNGSGAGAGTFIFSNVGPLGGDTYGHSSSCPIEIVVDDTNINIYVTVTQQIQYQRYYDATYGFGWDRYLKFWSDYSGSWYEFTFYILPYDKSSDIFIR